MHSIWMPLILDSPHLYRFLSGVWLPCKEGNENPQRGKPSHFADTNTCLLFIYPHQGPFLPIYKIIIRCSMYRIQVVSDSAIDTSRFWSASRICPLNSWTALWACLKITMDLRGIEPTPGFSPGFRFKFVIPVGTQVFLQKYYNKKLAIRISSNSCNCRIYEVSA